MKDTVPIEPVVLAVILPLVPVEVVGFVPVAFKVRVQVDGVTLQLVVHVPAVSVYPPGQLKVVVVNGFGLTVLFL